MVSSIRSFSLPIGANVDTLAITIPPQIMPVDVVVVNVACGAVELPVAAPVLAPAPLFAPVHSWTIIAAPSPRFVSESVATTLAVALDGLSKVQISTTI